MDTVRVDQLMAGDIIRLCGSKFKIDSIEKVGKNRFGDPLFLVHFNDVDDESEKTYAARKYGNTARWQGYLQVSREEVKQ